MAVQQRGRETRLRLLDAALVCFAKRGYDAAGVAEICRHAGVSKGAFYHHYRGKQALFLALLNQTATRLRDKIEEAIASRDDPIARADATLLTVLRTFAKHRLLARLFLVEAPGAGREFHQRILEIHHEFIGLIKQQLDAAVETGVIEPLDTQVASRAWFGALNEVITNWVLSSRPRRLEDAYTVLRPLLMRSVGIAPERRPAALRRP